jgi:hypothetical protein
MYAQHTITNWSIWSTVVSGHLFHKCYCQTNVSIWTGKNKNRASKSSFLHFGKKSINSTDTISKQKGNWTTLLLCMKWSFHAVRVDKYFSKKLDILVKKCIRRLNLYLGSHIKYHFYCVNFLKCWHRQICTRTSNKILIKISLTVLKWWTDTSNTSV